MDKYFCPYCNPKYQFVIKDNQGKLCCGLCGEYLIRKNLISIKRIVALIAILSITLPILYLLFFSINNFRSPSEEYYQSNNFLI